MFKHTILFLFLLLPSFQSLHASDDKPPGLWSVVSEFFGSMSQFPCYEENSSEEERIVGCSIREFQGTRHSDGKFLFFQDKNRIKICSSNGTTIREFESPVRAQKLLSSSDGRYLYLVTDTYNRDLYAIDLLTFRDHLISYGSEEDRNDCQDIFQNDSKFFILYRNRWSWIELKVFDLELNPPLLFTHCVRDSVIRGKILEAGDKDIYIRFQYVQGSCVSRFEPYFKDKGSWIKRHGALRIFEAYKADEVLSAKICGRKIFFFQEHSCPSSCYSLDAKQFGSLRIVSLDSGETVKRISLVPDCYEDQCSIPARRFLERDRSNKCFELCASSTEVIIVDKLKNRFIIIDAETLETQTFQTKENIFNLRNPLLVGTCLHLGDGKGKDYCFDLKEGLKEIPSDYGMFSFQNFLTWLVFSSQDHTNPFLYLTQDVRYYILQLMFVQKIASTSVWDWSETEG